MPNPRSYKKYVPVANVAKATHLMVSVYYGGGINYATYKVDPTGYYASIQPVTLAGPDYPSGFSSVSFGLFDGSGFKVFLKPGTRFSSKTLRDLAVKVHATLPSLAEAFDAGTPSAAYDALGALKDTALKGVAA